eukprot:224655_1
MPEFEVDLCGMKECVNVDWNEWHKFEIIHYINSQITKSNRILIGIAGGPGSGKTLFSKVLSLYMDTVLNIKNVCISADAYHYHNKTLIANNIRGQKGLPQSMDDDKLYTDMLSLTHPTPSRSVYFPIYDRSIHDPVDDAIEVLPSVKVVIFEGLFMIYWNKIRNLLDYVVFMDTSPQNMKNRLRDRKLKYGATLKDVQRNYDNIDSKTMQITASGKSDADCVIETAIINSKYKIIKATQQSKL